MIVTCRNNVHLRFFLPALFIIVFTSCLLYKNSTDPEIRESTMKSFINPKPLGLNDEKRLKTRNHTEFKYTTSGYHGPYTILPKRTWAIPYKQKWRSYTLPFITCTPNGRLGNVMGEYATLYALKRAYGTSVALHPIMHNFLRKFFKNITIPLLEGPFDMKEFTRITHMGETCNFAQVEVAAAGLLGPKPFVITEWAFETHLFHAYSSDVLLEFQFKDYIQTIARKRIKEIRSYWSKHNNNAPTDDLVLVSFHIRRTDYFNHIKNMFGGIMPGMEYFLKAMEYFKNKYSKLIFVMASDDPEYIKSTFSNNSDIFVNVGLTPEQDLCVLSFCNHSIVTLGSYGFWGSYLTGGEVIYPEVNATIQGYSFSRPFYEVAHLDRFKELPVR